MRFRSTVPGAPSEATIDGAQRRRPRWSVRPPARSGVIAGATVLPALFLLLNLPAVAVAPASSITLKAPYGGAIIANQTTIGATGCYNVTNGSAAFSRTTGLGTFWGNATTSSCGALANGTSGTSEVALVGTTSVEVPLSLPTGATGVTTVSATVGLNGSAYFHSHLKWKCQGTTWNASRASGGFVIAGCSASTQVRFGVTSAIINSTTGFPVTGPNITYFYFESGLAYSEDYCYPYACYWSNYSLAYQVSNLTHAESVEARGLLGVHGAYALEVTVQVLVESEVQGFLRGQITSSTNIGQSGADWSLESIVIT